MTPMIIWDWPNTPLTILAVVVIVALVRWGLVAAIRRWARRSTPTGNQPGATGPATEASPRRTQRLRTTASVLVNIVNAVAVVIGVLTVLSVVGIPMGPVLAGAGIGGLAIGFGAQSLVKDLISGLFMVAEDQYGVGDLINVDDIEGTVEEVGLRVTRLRQWSGQVWYIRNGEITKVGNQSQGWSTGVVEIPTHLSEDPDRVIGILEQVADEFYDDDAWHEKINERPAVWGLDAVGGQTMLFKMAVKTPTNQQFAPQRALRSKALIALKRAGVRSPSQIIETRDWVNPTAQADDATPPDATI